MFLQRSGSHNSVTVHWLQDLLERNSALADDLLVSSGRGEGGEEAVDNNAKPSKRGLLRVTGDSFLSNTEAETLRQQVQENHRLVEVAREEKRELEAEIHSYKQLLTKQEAELQSLSAAYNSLEQENFRLEGEVKDLRKALEDGGVSLKPSEEDLTAAYKKGHEVAIKESEADLSDLMVCLGQEESKVQKLRDRLEELGEDVDVLLQGLGEPEGEGEQDEEEEEEEG